MSSPPRPARASHAARIRVIAMHTFTQLMRMKVFYFLAIFASLIIASSFFDLSQLEGKDATGEHVLRLIKSASFGAMHLFSVVLAVVATALLLPKDAEDRTLYTILAKPVPRLDYLTGKLFGVLLLIAGSLALMDLLMVGILQIRTTLLIAQQSAMAQSMGYPPEALAVMREETLAAGSTWAVQAAVVAVFLRATVIAAIALLISTFSTSTLFTTVISFLVYFIGHFQADARDFYLQAGEAGTGPLARFASWMASLVLPDFQLFNVIDAVIEGQAMPAMLLVKLSLVAAYYALFFTLASWFVFADKEF